MNPGLIGADLETLSGCQDTLNRAESTLILLADLFTALPKHHTIFDSNEARHGMFLQLTGLANLMAAISDRLQRE